MHGVLTFSNTTRRARRTNQQKLPALVGPLEYGVYLEWPEYTIRVTKTFRPISGASFSSVKVRISKNTMFAVHV